MLRYRSVTVSLLPSYDSITVTNGISSRSSLSYSSQAKSSARAADSIKRDAAGPNEEPAAAAAAAEPLPLLKFIDLPSHFLVQVC